MTAQRDHDRRNWLRELFSLHGSVFPLIAPKVFALSVIAWGVTWVENHEHLPQLPMAPFAVLGTALGLLLTLRTTASYDRFWEGRKAWGSIVNRSRNLARQAVTTFGDPAAEQEFVRLISAFAHAAKHQLRKDPDVPELARLFPQGDLSFLTRAPGPAQRALVEMGRRIRAKRQEGAVDILEQKNMEEDLTVLVDALGVCERIQRTPIPIGYVLHLRRFLTLYCLTLTLALVDPLGWYSPLVIGFISYAFLGIERVGIEIQDPFERTPNSLDLDRIAATIEKDSSGLVGLELASS